MSEDDPFGWVRNLGNFLIAVAVGTAIYTVIDRLLS